MSFMFLTCAWCGEQYTFGIVGTTMIGSGHLCTKEIACDTEGCEQVARFLVCEMKASEDQSFACSDHIGDRVICATQPHESDKDT